MEEGLVVWPADMRTLFGLLQCWIPTECEPSVTLIQISGYSHQNQTLQAGIAYVGQAYRFGKSVQKRVMYYCFFGRIFYNYRSNVPCFILFLWSYGHPFKVKIPIAYVFWSNLFYKSFLSRRQKSRSSEIPCTLIFCIFTVWEWIQLLTWYS